MPSIEMVDQPNSLENFYALLIGIDIYNENSRFTSLKGAVRDIKLVAEYLEKTLKLPPEKIFKLTSSNPESPSANQPIEPAEALPTYANIVRAFNAITEKAPEGSQIYIHYSGHGGRVRTSYPEQKGANQPDEGIVPMDFKSGGRYLLDVELAMLLQQMRNKGLIVTVILDSCHSGGATRGDDVAIRGNDDIDPELPQIKSLVADDEKLIENWEILTEGTTSTGTEGRWLPQPKDSRDYVLLAACRPNEFAYEYTVSGKQRNGALTYWMINTLTSSLSGLTYKALHDRISAKIQSKFSNQMPMLMGEIDRVVFGDERIPLQYAVNVLEIDPEPDELDQEQSDPEQVRLSTGMAGGIGIGARFAIYPRGTIDFTKKVQPLAIVEISENSEVGASDSWADVVEIINRDSKIEAGCQAVMTSAPIDLVRAVRLLRKEVGDQDNELPQSLVDQQDSALKEVEVTLADSGWLKLVDNQQKEDYLVAVNRAGEYEICKGLPIENLHPALMISDAEAPAKLVKRLIHLAKYQAIQELSNQDSELSVHLEVKLLTQAKWKPGRTKNPQPFADPTNVVIEDGEYIFLQVKNLSKEELPPNKKELILNVVVLDLDPELAVSRLQLYGAEENSYTFNPGQELVLPLRPQLPANLNRGQETYKVFASVQNIDLRWLELPPLNEEIKSKSQELKRGDNPLDKLIAAMGSDIDSNPSMTRASIPIFDPEQQWVTKEVQFTLVR
jgi:hypothetical protein